MERAQLEKMTASLARYEESARDRVMQEIQALGLAENVIELDTVGYTIVPNVLDQTTVERTLAAILARVDELTGKRVDLKTATAEDFQGMTYLPYLIYDDPVFTEVLLEPKPLALMTYLLGESCQLSSLGTHFKGPGEEGVLPLHSDNGNGMPAPFPTYSQVANINYALTPYSREAGALALVPGSHKWCRPPTPNEWSLSGETTNPSAIAMDINPGDAVIWHGNTWHGSFARQIPGIRANLAVYMCRQYVQTQEHHREKTPDEYWQANDNSTRLRTLLGGKQPYGWTKEGPDYTVMAKNPKSVWD